ncbi:hypothetical protein AKJ40_04170 [candidate division MSBL1 archaeon SCGC-AAA259M10]|uniref:DNA polymerase beta n=1 Tax=candidate division MSBL1 archaeon SCGC-AAA259M10 TaxID=1698270 RepID=A0A133UXU8_9EURY|nr:hypothetical protein AKJ40_04170 [candidate division MSBL1 archaeon SCGC-AAA259M10]
MKNKEVSRIFNEIADFLEIKGVDYKPRAYRKAARNIEALTEDIESIHDRGELQEIGGIGEALAGKISEYLETGELEYYEELREDLPVDIEGLTNIEGIGPKSVKKLHDGLGVETLEDLEEAAEGGEVVEVKGFGEKVQGNILENIERAKRSRERKLLGRISPLVQDIERRLSGKDTFNRINIVGSYRRGKPTVGDVDILATAEDREEAMDEFCGLEDVEEVLVKGETKSSTVLSAGVQVDLRIVDEGSFGSALMYFTGSKDHNVSVRGEVKGRGWKLNEYGLFDSEGEKLAGETENEVYGKLGMSYIPPELRENTGEVEAAEDGSLPDLVEGEDIKGDLQIHTNYSDGSGTVREMAEKAAGKGLEYLSISDHGPSLKVAGGLTEEDFEEQAAEIERVSDEVEIEILHGVEANIVEGGLDVSKEWCERCDLLCAAMHDRPDNSTERILSVLDEYPVDILVHPLGRKILSRDPLKIDLDRITDRAAEEHVAVEINAQPESLDLDWQNVKKYRGKVKYAVSTDAHSRGEMDFMHLGVTQARRGWCEAGNVLNTKKVDKVRSYLNG